jgi:hypothetical protein
MIKTVGDELNPPNKSMRSQYIFDPKTPGPGTYETSAGEIGYEANRSRERLRKTSKDSIRTSGSVNSSIGSRDSKRSSSKGSKDTKNFRYLQSPGPGTYEVRESFDKLVEKKGHVKLNKTGHGESKFLILNEFSPGPVYMTPYEQVPGLIKTISKLGKPDFLGGINDNPGPGEYNVAEAYDKLIHFRKEIERRRAVIKNALYD